MLFAFIIRYERKKRFFAQGYRVYLTRLCRSLKTLAVLPSIYCTTSSIALWFCLRCAIFVHLAIFVPTFWIELANQHVKNSRIRFELSNQKHRGKYDALLIQSVISRIKLTKKKKNKNFKKRKWRKRVSSLISHIWLAMRSRHSHIFVVHLSILHLHEWTSLCEKQNQNTIWKKDEW